jgi:hypothetical protein
MNESNDSAQIFDSRAESFSSWDSNMTQVLPGPMTESCGTVRFSLVLTLKKKLHIMTMGMY